MASNYAVEVRRMLEEAGCRFDRQGKGDHEIWLCPRSRRPIVVDNMIKSRHTANGILKQAGLPKHF
jgi:HicA toxin of bacterial toxin-antitoxin,